MNMDSTPCIVSGSSLPFSKVQEKLLSEGELCNQEVKSLLCTL